jgi:hypothetical protein
MVFDPNVLMNNFGDLLLNVGIFVAVILVGILLGYLIGALIASIVKRILGIRELKEQIASSEIISLSFWSKVINGIGVYIKWLFVSVVLHYVVEGSLERGIWYAKLSQYTGTFQSFMGGLGVFILFGVVGIVIGAIVYKIIKAALDSVRVEERMAKHGLHDALGGLQLTKVVAGIFMIYVVIVFLATGIDAVARPIGQDQNALVLMFNNPDMPSNSLVELYPQFVLGGFIIMAGALVGDFIQDRIKESKTSLASDSVAWLVQAMVIFFAIVLALPHFQIRENVDILTDSFKIVVAGVSIGMAIAMGLGLKETFSHWGKKIEKKL